MIEFFITEDFPKSLLKVSKFMSILSKLKVSMFILKQTQANSVWNEGTKEALIRYGQLAQEINDAEPESLLGYG